MSDNMKDVEKICRNCEYTLGGYGIPIMENPTTDTCCHRKSATLVKKNCTCKWFKPIEKSKFNLDVPIDYINWNGDV